MAMAHLIMVTTEKNIETIENIEKSIPIKLPWLSVTPNCPFSLLFSPLLFSSLQGKGKWQVAIRKSVITVWRGASIHAVMLW